MAIDYANEGADLRAAEVANPLLWTLLVDKTDLYSVGMLNFGDLAGSGSSTTNISQVDLDDAMTAPAEGAAVAVTDFGTSSVQAAIARQAIRRTYTDLFVGTGAPGMAMTPQKVAEDIANAVTIRRTGLIAALFSSVANSVGTTTVDLSVDDIYDAIFQLQNESNEPPFFVTLYPEQFNNFMNSLRGEGGANQFKADTAMMMGAKPPGFKGVWNNVQFWTSDQVPTANGGADSAGCMWSLGAFGYVEGNVAPMLKNAGSLKETVPERSPAWIEFQRDPASGLTDVVGNYYTGVVENEDLRACAIITDR